MQKREFAHPSKILWNPWQKSTILVGYVSTIHSQNAEWPSYHIHWRLHEPDDHRWARWWEALLLRQSPMPWIKWLLLSVAPTYLLGGAGKKFDSSGKWIMTRSLDTVLSPRNCTARQTAWQMPRRMIAEGLWKFHVWCILLSFWMVLLNENHWIYMKWSPLWWECQDLYTSVVSRFLGARFDIPISMRIRQRARRVHAQGWTRRFISVASNCIASGSCDLWILQGTCDTDCHSILGQSWKTMTCQSYRAIQLLQSIFEWFPIPNHCCQADRFANDLHTNLTALTQKADACDDRIEWNYIEYGLTTLFGTLRLHGCRMVYSWLPSNIGG